MLHSLITGLLVLGLSGSAPAQESNASARSRVLYEKAMAAAASGDYAEAALGFDVAFRFSGVSMLLWNAARSYHRAGDLSTARQRYFACTKANDLPLSRRRQAAYQLREIEATLRRQGAHSLPKIEVPELYTPRAHSTPPHRQSAPKSNRPKHIGGGAHTSEADETTNRFPTRFTSRSMTLPEQTLSLAGGVGAGVLYRDADGNIVLEGGTEAVGGFASSAISYGALDILEFGAVFLALEAFPKAIYDEPSVYGIVSIFSSPGYEIGAMVEVLAGVQPNSPWTLSIGSPSIIEYKWFRLDGGAYLDLEFGDSDRASIRLPLHLHFQMIDQLYGSVLVSTIITNTETDDEPQELVTHPFGLALTYTFEMNARPLCDLQAYIIWPFLHGNSDEDAWLHTDTLMGGLSARFYMAL